MRCYAWLFRISLDSAFQLPKETTASSMCATWPVIRWYMPRGNSGSRISRRRFPSVRLFITAISQDFLLKSEPASGDGFTLGSSSPPKLGVSGGMNLMELEEIAEADFEMNWDDEALSEDGEAIWVDAYEI